MSTFPFAEVLRDASRGVRKVPQREFLAEGQYPIIDQGQQPIAGYCNIEKGLCTTVPAIIFGDHTRCVKFVEEPFAAGADGVKILVPTRDKDNPRYLYHALRSADIPSLGYSRHFKLVKELSFVVPEREQQDEIVELLDAVDYQNFAVENQLVSFDELVKSRFFEMFGNISEGESLFETESIEDLSLAFLGGGTPSMKHPEYYEDGIIPWLKSGDIKSRRVTSGTINITQVGLENSTAKIVPEGTVIVVTRSGILKHTLPVAITNNPVAINQDLKAIIPSREIISDYLQWALLVSEPRILSNVRATTADNIETSYLKNYEVPVPPYELQQEFAAFVQHVDKLKFIAQQQIEKLQMLYDSLAREYFGE